MVFRARLAPVQEVPPGGTGPLIGLPQPTVPVGRASGKSRRLASRLPPWPGTRQPDPRKFSNSPPLLEVRASSRRWATGSAPAAWWRSCPRPPTWSAATPTGSTTCSGVTRQDNSVPSTHPGGRPETPNLGTTACVKGHHPVHHHSGARRVRRALGSPRWRRGATCWCGRYETCELVPDRRELVVDSAAASAGGHDSGFPQCRQVGGHGAERDSQHGRQL